MISKPLGIRFKGRDYVLVGTLETGGPIATKRQYENGLMSFADLAPDGVIRRYRKIIGKREDITVTRKFVTCHIKATAPLKAMENLIEALIGSR